MKIQPGKFDDLLVDMLVHIQSEIQVMRNFILTEHVDRTGKDVDTVAKEYEEMYIGAKTALIAQIKSRYVDGFDADEILSKFK